MVSSPTAAAAAQGSGSQEVLRIGIIGDIQYADVDDGRGFDGEARHFRNTLRILEGAVERWNAEGACAIVQLGDAIDGRNAQAGTSESALKDVLDVLARSKAELRLDLVGNHELYNIQRLQLPSSGLNFRKVDGGEGVYCTHTLSSCWEAIVLDAYEMALIGYGSEPENHLGYQQAVELCKLQNPGVLDNTKKDWLQGLPEDKHRYIPFNGGVSEAQLAWLDTSICAAASAGRTVLVFTHCPLYQPATQPKTVMWNGEEVLSVLHKHKEHVLAVLAGHDHDGGYAVDPAGIHHVTFMSPLTATPGNDCSATMECSPGGGSARLLLFGKAVCESNTHSEGRPYPYLDLSKGAVNQPE